MRNIKLHSAIFLLFGVFIATKPVISQGKLSFGLNVGVGIPMNDYGKTDSTKLPLSIETTNAGKGNDTTKYNGYAKTGFHFNVYAQYMIVGPLGLKLFIGGSMNSFDMTAFSNTNISIYNNSYNPVPTWTESGQYYIGQYLIGPCIKLPAGNKLKIEAQALLGLVMGNYPKFISAINYSAGGPGFGFTSSESGKTAYSTVSASGFGYDLGVGLECMIAQKIGLHLNISYTSSTLSYSSYNQISNYTTTYNGNTSYTSSNSTYNIPKTMSIGLLQLTLGGSIDL